MRETHMKTMLFNPYTGLPRHPSDIASDPAGTLMLDPDEPVPAFARWPQEAPMRETPTTPTTAISAAVRILRREAAAIRECHTPSFDPDDWTDAEEAKAWYDEMLAVADELETWSNK